MENIRLNKFQIILLILGLAAIFLLVYSPSFSTPFPKHFDEWQHINYALSLGRGEYPWQKLPNFSLGFHFFLYGISQIADLVQVYKFIAPTWAVLAALTLFFVVYIISGRNFLLAFSAIIFFGSIKSNINLLGLYFFVPLSFSIPFIFLFIFFFIRGLEKENKKYLLLSFLIMLFLIPVHATSVIFALPILLISCVLYYKYIKKEFRFFLIFLLIFLLGLFFYSFVRGLAVIDSLGILIKELHFRGGLGRAEVFNDSLTTTYSIAGGVLAGIGFLIILWMRKKELYPYIIWPLYLLLMILIFRMTDISYLSPYHRNFYYFTISLPLLSAFGLSWIINTLTSRFKRINFKFIAVPVLIIAMFFSFISYGKEDPRRPSYAELLTVNDYQDLIFLAQFSRGKALVHPSLSVVAAPITEHKIVGEFFDEFGREHVWEFFDSDDCHFKDALIKVYKIDYLISSQESPCGYKLLRGEHYYIYQVNSIANK
jgi:hypothetical protein